jgi:hypothetical protein
MDAKGIESLTVEDRKKQDQMLNQMVLMVREYAGSYGVLPFIVWCMKKDGQWVRSEHTNWNVQSVFLSKSLFEVHSLMKRIHHPDRDGTFFLGITGISLIGELHGWVYSMHSDHPIMTYKPAYPHCPPS